MRFKQEFNFVVSFNFNKILNKLFRLRKLYVTQSGVFLKNFQNFNETEVFVREKRLLLRQSRAFVQQFTASSCERVVRDALSPFIYLQSTFLCNATPYFLYIYYYAKRASLRRILFYWYISKGLRQTGLFTFLFSINLLLCFIRDKHLSVSIIL